MPPQYQYDRIDSFVHNPVLVHGMHISHEIGFFDSRRRVCRDPKGIKVHFSEHSFRSIFAKIAGVVVVDRFTVWVVGVVNHGVYCTVFTMSYRRAVRVIVDPTASGKSGVAIRLAKKLKGEVVSADSRQVYKGLNVGTGKVTKKEMAGVPHHLLDVASPKRKFSAGDYAKAAHKAIADISKRGKLPIVAGGTGFYIDALFGRIELPEVKPNPALRKKLAGKSAAQLFALLKKKDPKRAKAMDTDSERNNAVRLIRALEIAAAPKRAIAPRFNLGGSYETLWIGISPALTVLDTKIKKRLVERIKKQGMVLEAKRLHEAGLSYKRMRELGLEYRSLADYLEKKITIQEMIDTLYSEIRRYARKQTGYWNRNSDIEWFSPMQTKEIEKRVSNWVKEK